MLHIMETKIYNTQGKEVKTITLPEKVFGVPWNADLVHQVVIGMSANARAGKGLAHTKDRGEVRGGGKKPWKQKGTGQARHGSRRSPIWVGGGITHGPRSDKDYSQTIPRKMRVKALYTALSQKLRDGEILFVDSLGLTEPKAKTAKILLTTFAAINGFEKISKKNNAALIAVPLKDLNVKKSFQNFSNTEVELVQNLNPVDVLTYKYLIIEDPDASLKVLESKVSSKKKQESKD